METTRNYGSWVVNSRKSTTANPRTVALSDTGEGISLTAKNTLNTANNNKFINVQTLHDLLGAGLAVNERTGKIDMSFSLNPDDPAIQEAIEELKASLKLPIWVSDIRANKLGYYRNTGTAAAPVYELVEEPIMLTNTLVQKYNFYNSIAIFFVKNDFDYYANFDKINTIFELGLTKQATTEKLNNIATTYAGDTDKIATEQQKLKDKDIAALKNNIKCGRYKDYPFASIQQAVNRVTQNYNMVDYNVYIVLLDKTYNLTSAIKLGSFSTTTGKIVIQPFIVPDSSLYEPHPTSTARYVIKSGQEDNAVDFFYNDNKRITLNRTINNTNSIVDQDSGSYIWKLFNFNLTLEEQINTLIFPHIYQVSNYGSTQLTRCNYKLIDNTVAQDSTHGSVESRLLWALGSSEFTFTGGGKFEIRAGKTASQVHANVKVFYIENRSLVVFEKSNYLYLATYVCSGIWNYFFGALMSSGCRTHGSATYLPRFNVINENDIKYDSNDIIFYSKRFALSSGSYINAGKTNIQPGEVTYDYSAGQTRPLLEYFPGKTAGSIETSSYCFVV